MVEMESGDGMMERSKSGKVEGYDGVSQYLESEDGSWKDGRMGWWKSTMV